MIPWISPLKRSTLPGRSIVLAVSPKWRDDYPSPGGHTFERAETALFPSTRALLSLRGDHRVWDDASALVAYIDECAQEKKRLWLFAANAGRDLWLIDFYRKMGERGWTLEWVHDHSPIYCLRTRKGKRSLQVASLGNFVPGSLEELGTLLFPSRPASSVPDPTHFCLSEQPDPGLAHLTDLIVAYISFLTQHDAGRFSNTISAQAWTCWRHRFLGFGPRPTEDPWTRTLEGLAYRGPRSECYYLGELPRGDYAFLDVIGMYAHVMVRNPVPVEHQQTFHCSSVEMLRNLLHRHLVIAEVWINTDEPLYPILSRGNLIFPVGRFTTTLCSESIRRALRRGHIRRVGEVACYRRGYILREHNEYWLSQRMIYEEAGDRFLATLCKRMSTGLYGKFGQRRPKIVKEEPCSPETLLYEVIYSPEFDLTTTTMCLMGKKLVMQGWEENPKSLRAIAAHIVDYSRWYLWDIMCRAKGRPIYYCDADAFIINGKDLGLFSDLLEPRRPGGLQIARRGETLEIYGRKDYKIGDQVVIKGLPLGATKAGDRQWQCEEWPGLRELLSTGEPGYYPMRRISWKASATYRGGIVRPDGWVDPIRLEEPYVPFDGSPPSLSASVPDQPELAAEQGLFR